MTNPPLISPDGHYWWDGSAWQPITPPPAPPPSPPDSRPFWRRRLKLILAILGGAFVVWLLVGVILLAGSPSRVCFSSPGTTTLCAPSVQVQP